MRHFIATAFLVFGVFALSENVRAGVDGAITGVVTDSQGISLEGAKIQLFMEGSSAESLKPIQSRVTGLEGRYDLFPIQAGVYRLEVSKSGFTPKIQKEIHVGFGGVLTFDFRLDIVEEMQVEVTVAKRKLPAAHSVSSTEMNQEKIRQLPMGSETSLPRLLTTTTPGAVEGPFGQIFFRGNHGNIQYQIDGVQMPESPSNTFGQAFSPRNIDHMEVITGGIPAEYGQRLSAVVNVVTKSGKEEPGGEIELNYGSYNTTTPHLLYGGSNESGDLRYFFSLNYNQTSRGLDTPQPFDSTHVDQGGAESVHNDASGNGEFAKVDWQVDNQNKLIFTLFHAYNRFQIPNYPSSFSPNDAFFSQVEDHGSHSHRLFNYVPADTDNSQAERNAYMQVVWKHTFSERSFLQIAPYYKYSQIIVNNDLLNDLYTAPGGAMPIAEASPSSLSMNRHVNDLGLKVDYSLRPNDWHLLKTGFQLQASQADGGFTVQRSLDPVVAASHPSHYSTVADDHSTTGFFGGVYVQDDFKFAESWVLNAGLRYDATHFQFFDLNSSDGLLQPRVGLNYQATDTTRLHIFYGKLFQPAAVQNLRYSFSSGRTPGPYDIKAEKDDFYELGVAQQVFDQHVISLNVYYKTMVNILDDGQLLNTSITHPFNYESGYGYGVEFSLAGKINEDWSEYFNYAYGVAMGKGISGGLWASHAAASTDYQYLDHVQLHTANAGLTYAKNNFWWSGQTVFGSGLPKDEEKTAFLPAHITFDTSIGYQFTGKSVLSQFKISADVLNIFDNRYPITIANGFNGSHYAAGRQFYLRLIKFI